MIHFIHGILTEPTSPVKGLLPYLQSVGPAVYPDYGYELAVDVKHVNPMIAGALLPYIQPGDILVGHSNGCALSYELLMAGALVTRAVFINGALETTFPLPAGLQSLDVYFNADDDITEAAAVAERLGLVDKVWGELGHAGYQGKDPRVTNFNCGLTAGMPVVQGHSDFFTPAKLAEWGPFLASRIR